MVLFQNRAHAGRVLAGKLGAYAGRHDVIVLGLPRGGVPVAEQVAIALGEELDVFIVRKLGVPEFEELAMGAIASGGVVVVNQEVVDRLAITDDMFDSVAQQGRAEVEYRERMYRGDRPPPHLTGRTVVLVDDGMATGASMRAAAEAVRIHGPAHITVAVPVAPPESCADVGSVADAVICAETPEPFHSVGLWYEDFAQTTDAEVRDVLERSRRPEATFTSPPPAL